MASFSGSRSMTSTRPSSASDVSEPESSLSRTSTRLRSTERSGSRIWMATSSYSPVPMEKPWRSHDRERWSGGTRVRMLPRTRGAGRSNSSVRSNRSRVLHVIDECAQLGQDLPSTGVVEEDPWRRDGEAGQKGFEPAFVNRPLRERTRDHREPETPDGCSDERAVVVGDERPGGDDLESPLGDHEGPGRDRAVRAALAQAGSGRSSILCGRFRERRYSGLATTTTGNGAVNRTTTMSGAMS